MPEDELQMLIDDAASYMHTLCDILHEFALNDETNSTYPQDEEKRCELTYEEEASVRGTAA